MREEVFSDSAAVMIQFQNCEKKFSYWILSLIHVLSGLVPYSATIFSVFSWIMKPLITLGLFCFGTDMSSQQNKKRRENQKLFCKIDSKLQKRKILKRKKGYFSTENSLTQKACLLSCLPLPPIPYFSLPCSVTQDVDFLKANSLRFLALGFWLRSANVRLWQKIIEQEERSFKVFIPPAPSQAKV